MYRNKLFREKIDIIRNKIIHHKPILGLCHVFTFLLFFQGFQVYSQDTKFYHFTDNDHHGLGSVWAIIEDHQGFMWFGTTDGLYKYDGYEIIAYHHDENDSNSICGNFIVTIFEDSHKNLWIGSYGGGLSLYNREKNIFRNFVYDENNPNSIPINRVKTIAESKDGTLWFGTEGGGIAYFNPGNEIPENVSFSIIRNKPDQTNSLPNDFIRSIAIDKSNRIIIGTYGGGLSIYTKATDTFKNYNSKSPNSHRRVSDLISEVFIDSKDRIWIGSFDNGLYLFQMDKNSFVSYPASNESYSLNDNEVESIAEDPEGGIWCATDNGLSKMLDANSKVPQNKFKNYRHENLDASSIMTNILKMVYVDSRGILWAGSYFGGLNVSYGKYLKFSPIRNKPWIDHSLSFNNVSGFAEDVDGDLWISINGGGINILKQGIHDIYADNYTSVPLINPNSNELQEKAHDIAIDQQGNAWATFWSGGLYKIDKKTLSSQYFGPGDEWGKNFEAFNIEEVEVDHNNNIWIGTFRHGIYFYDQKSKVFKSYIPVPVASDSSRSERVRTILIDSQQRIWAGGDLGSVFKYNPEIDQFEAIPYTKNVTIMDIVESKEGMIWAGTNGDGLLMLNPETNNWTTFGKNDNIPVTTIQSVLEDNNGKIWMSTSIGLYVYDWELREITRYSALDGLQNNFFNNGSALKTSNGMMLFGGKDGWNAFYPNSIRTNTTKPNIVFTNFWLNDQLMNVDNPESPLEYNINSNKPISLNHKQNSFSVEVAALEYHFSNINEYSYFLEGFHQNWQKNGTDRKIKFTNLSPGTYTLKVKATNHDGVWFDKEMPLEINIVPAIWQTATFKYLLILTLILLVIASHRIRLNYLINQRKRLELEVVERTSEIKAANLQLDVKNNEILAQNEELVSQNEHINLQKIELEETRDQLRNINEKLEKIVRKRTKKLEITIKELDSTVETLDKTVKELDRFVYSASHDLSAPLKSIRGLVNIAKIGDNKDNMKECLNYIANSVSRLEEVIQSLVEYSRNTHLDIKVVPVNLYTTVNDIIEELAFVPNAEKVKITNNLTKTQLINTDLGRIKIILHNLISNGIKYSDFSKKESYINIDLSLDDNMFKIKVADNGIGIEKTHQKQIFHMYYRASEQSEGSGLGLFIVNEIVNKMGGEITVESSKGVGSTFKVTLPALSPNFKNKEEKIEA